MPEASPTKSTRKGRGESWKRGVSIFLFSVLVCNWFLCAVKDFSNGIDRITITIIIIIIKETITDLKKWNERYAVFIFHENVNNWE
jgi:hypothetical protein